MKSYLISKNNKSYLNSLRKFKLISNKRNKLVLNKRKIQLNYKGAKKASLIYAHKKTFLSYSEKKNPLKSRVSKTYLTFNKKGSSKIKCSQVLTRLICKSNIDVGSAGPNKIKCVKFLQNVTNPQPIFTNLTDNITYRYSIGETDCSGGKGIVRRWNKTNSVPAGKSEYVDPRPLTQLELESLTYT